MPHLRKPDGSEAGIATAAVIVMSAVLTILAFFILDLSRGYNQRSTESLLYYNSVDIIKSNIYALSVNYVAWENTYNLAANGTAGGSGTFSCMKDATNCPVEGGSLILQTPTDDQYYNPESPTQGFNLAGIRCNTYDSADKAGNLGCILKPTVRWKPFCELPCPIPPNKGFLYVTIETPAADGYSFQGMNIFGLSKP